MQRLTISLALTFVAAAAATGCSSYAVPSTAADMSAFGLEPAPEALAEDRRAGTDHLIRNELAKKPLASFPSHIAIARVQSATHVDRETIAHGRGKYRVITSRTVEKESDLAELASLPEVAGLATMNRLLLPDSLDSDRELRAVAAKLHADMLLVYTFDTAVYLGDAGSPVDVVTFGFLPKKQARVRSIASAVLLDTRNGYVYAVAESQAEVEAESNAWNKKEAVDQTRKRAETEAFRGLVDDFARAWLGVVRHYAGGPKTAVTTSVAE